jgi:hypothetical protein
MGAKSSRLVMTAMPANLVIKNIESPPTMISRITLNLIINSAVILLYVFFVMFPIPFSAPSQAYAVSP